MKHFIPTLLSRARIASWLCSFVLVFPVMTLAADSIHRGMDVILLIDVSGSMAEQNGYIEDAYGTGKWTGSDPQRIRWDAVKMLVDLLDANDRILILRFNETCPARNGKYLVNNQPAQPEDLFLPGRTPLTRENDFPTVLQFCDGRTQLELSSQIAQFNHPLTTTPRTNAKTSQHEDGWKLDGGGTNVIDALGALAAPITKFCYRDIPERPKRIILLTDGCDQNIDQFVENPDGDESAAEYQPRINTRLLSESLSFLRPTRDFGSVDADHKIPVYTVGLKLKELPNGKALETEETIAASKRRYPNAPVGKIGDRRKWSVWGRDGDILRLNDDFPEPHFQQQKANALLNTISELTGGESHAIDNSGELLTLYSYLIRNLKGLWYKQETLLPGEKNVLKIPVVSAVNDFRLLARVKNEQSDVESKRATLPPVFDFDAGSWQPPQSDLASPVLRQGSGKTLYALWFGGDLVTPTPGNPRPTPFAHLNGPVDWVVPLGKESSPIETIHFKRVSEDFGWPPRSPDSSSEVRFYRHQLATIQLSAVTDLIKAVDFEWKLKWRNRDKLEELPIPFREVGNDSLASFDPDKVSPQSWTKSRSSQSFLWTLFAEGKPTTNTQEKVLTRFSREFPTWRFSILNELPLRIREPISAIALSEDDNKLDWTVETQFPQSIAKIPMKLTFERPQFKNSAGKMVPIDSELLALAVIAADNQAAPLASLEEGTARFELKDGRARLRIQFQSQNKAHFPPPGADIQLGSIQMEADVPDLTKSTVLKIPVGLVFEKPNLTFYEDSSQKKKLTLATATPVKDDPHRTKIFLAPIKPRGTGKRIALTLNYSKHPKDAGNQPLPLSSEEFRLLNENGTELEKDANAWIAEFTGKPIGLLLETKLAKDRRADSTAMATLSAVGPGFSQGDLELLWTFPPREVDMQLEGDGQPARVEPGKVARFAVLGKISNHPEDARVRVTERIRELGLRFENIEDDTYFYVPLQNLEWFGVSGKNVASVHRTEIPLVISKNQPVGEYRAELAFEEKAEIGAGDTKELVSTRLKRSAVTLSLILDRLIAEVQNPHNPKEWVTAAQKNGDQEEYHFLLYGHYDSQLERRIRIRSERGEQFIPITSPKMKDMYTLATDVGRSASDPFSCKVQENGMAAAPEWILTFPPLKNIDPILDFGAKLTIDRDGSLQRTLKFKLRLLLAPEPK